MTLFAASAFDARENVKLGDQTKISLPAYAARIKLELVSAADLNEKLRDRGVKKEITVQEICRIAKDEKEVRETLSRIWEKPQTAREITSQVITKNRSVYEFEKILEEPNQPVTVKTIQQPCPHLLKKINIDVDV
jgi:urease gamma subunit